MKTKEQISTQFKKRKGLSLSGLQRQYDLIKDCTAFYVGDMMDYRDSVQFTDQAGKRRRAMVQFNRVKPYINAVSGFMVQNRKQAKYLARIGAEPAQSLYTDYSNACAEYVRENADAENAESQMAKDMLIGGVGAVETCMVYGDGYAAVDSNGEIRWIPLDVKSVGWDPASRQQNLIDSRWVFYSKEYDLDEALELFDDSNEEDFDPDTGEQYKSPIKYDRLSGANYRTSDAYDWASEEANRVKVYFYQWYDIEKFYRADNPIFQTQDPVFAMRIASILEGIKADVDDEGFDPRAEVMDFNSKTRALILEQFEDAIEIYPYKRKVFYTAVLSGKKVFSSYKNVSQQGFTVQFETGDWDAKNRIFHGMVSSLREPALYYNKSLTELMFTISANSKGGVLVERAAVTDIREFEQKYAKTDAVIIVEDGALSGGKIQPKKSPFAPTGYDNIIALSDAAIGDASGIDKSFLGSSENRAETALLQRRRVKQVITTLANYFDSISLYQKLNARILLDMMRVWAENNPGALIPIVGERGKTEFMMLQEDPFMAEYAVTIQEAPQSAEEKVEIGQMAAQMAAPLLALGDPAGKALLALSVKYTNFDETDKQRILEILMPEQQTADPSYVKQLEQLAEQLQSQAQQAQMQKLASDTALNVARAEEVAAKIKKTNADIQKTGAETVKTLEEAERFNTETELARKATLGTTNITL